MNCETVEELLLDYLEGQLEPDQMATIRAHVEACPACRRSVRETRDLIDAMELARRRQEQAWNNESQPSMSVGTRERARSFTFDSGQRLGDFEIVGEIGRGGMGVVYRARQITLNRIVALKVLPATICQTEDAIKRFVREAQAAAKLHHTNIVPVYAQDECDGHFFYAMELIDGPNLGWMMKDDRSAILSGLDAVASSGIFVAPGSSGITRADAPSTRRRADYRRIAKLMAAVADGLEHAHRLHVIHRDIKPQNLLFGNDGQFHITDFGLARLLDEPNMTVTGEMLGTPAYMSPEQIDADRTQIDHRTDIYSLGVTLYELLTGKRPFDGVSREQVIARIRDREPVAPRKIDPNIPIDLDTICLRAMEKSPNRRYQSAEALSEDLRRFAENKPIHARRVGPVEKAVKWIRRHPAKFTIAVLVVAMIAGGFIWDAQARANRRQKANDMQQDAFELLAVDDYRKAAQAQEILLNAAPMNPDEANYRKTLGLSYVITDPTKALQELEHAYRLQPNDTETMYILAWVMRRLDRNNESKQWIERAEAIGGPSTEYDFFFRATARVWSQPDEAAGDYEQANAIRQRTKKKGYFQAMVHNGRAKNQRMYHTRNADDFRSIEGMFVGACVQFPENPYPHYLLSLANKIRAEIHYDSGALADARLRFEASRRSALDAIDADSESPRGYAALADFWESVSDRKGLADAGESGDLESLIKQLKSKEQSRAVERDDCYDWLGSLDHGLEFAAEARTKGWPWCKNKEDEIEFLEYRWGDHFWLGRFDQAQADLSQLGPLVSESSDKTAIWFKQLFPELLAAEQRGVDMARRNIVASTTRGGYTDLTSRACLLHILGDPSAAREILNDCEALSLNDTSLKKDAPDNWWSNACQILTDPNFNIETDWPDFAAADSLHRAAPLFFQGAVALGSGDREAARRWFLQCEACYDFEDYNYLARIFRRKMDADPDWPPWNASTVEPAAAPPSLDPAVP